MFRSVCKIVGIGFLLTAASCSEVVEPIQLSGLTVDATQQEEFEINVQPLTFDAAQKLNEMHFERLVSRPGGTSSANVVPEKEITKSSFPSTSKNQNYKLGIGDEITLIQYVENVVSIGTAGALIEQGSADFSATKTPSIITTSGRVGTDGSLLLIGVGRINALGRSIEDLRDEVRNIMIRDGGAPNFQMELSGFNSQRAYLTTNTTGSSVIPITDTQVTLRDLIVRSNLSLNENVLTIIEIQRNGETYAFKLADILDENSPVVDIRDQDHVFVRSLAYKPGKVFLLGGVNPTVIPIKPEERQSMADALFAPGGPLAVSTAQRSAVYLLRGRDPVQAYHLDARNPLSVVLADAVELRPNDIVFVAEQPISTFSRTLGNLIPLRVFLRDIRDNNFP